MAKALLLLIVVASLVLAFYWLRAGRPRPGPAPRTRPARPPRVVGPDDDPDFLRGLGRQPRRNPDEDKPGD